MGEGEHDSNKNNVNKYNILKPFICYMNGNPFIPNYRPPTPEPSEELFYISWVRNLLYDINLTKSSISKLDHASTSLDILMRIKDATINSDGISYEKRRILENLVVGPSSSTSTSTCTLDELITYARRAKEREMTILQSHIRNLENKKTRALIDNKPLTKI